MPKYVPQNFHTRSWEQIAEMYLHFTSEDERYRPLSELVGFIIKNNLSTRLFGFVSIISYSTLIVSIYEPVDRQKEALHINFDLQRDRWHFEYHAQQHQPIEMERYYDAHLGIEKFCQFIEWLKW